MCPLCYQRGGSLLHCLSTLTARKCVPADAFPFSIAAVYFCCTGLGVTSTGRYPASCPAKPGLSSSAAFRHLQPRLSVLLDTVFDYTEFRKGCPHPFHLISSLILFIYSQSSAITELCCPGGRAFARSIAQRTRKAAKDAA